MTDLSPDAKDLLQQARQDLAPNDATKASMLAGIEARLAAPTVLAPTAGGSPLLLKLIGGLALVGAIGAGAWWMMRSDESPAPSAQVEQRVAATAETEAAPAAEPDQVSAAEAVDRSTEGAENVPSQQRGLGAPGHTGPGEPNRPQTEAVPEPEPETVPVRKRQRSANPGDIIEERRLIVGANQALSKGNTQAARALLDEHKKRFRKGVLAPERGELEAIWRCQSRPGESSSDKARTLLEKRPSSPLRRRIEQSCQL